MKDIKKVLIIGDDSVVIESLVLLLRDHYQITISADPLHIWNNGNEFEPDAVFLDLDIEANGSLDGLFLLHKIKERKPSLPVVVVSCCLAQKVIKRAVGLGVADYLVKPLDLDMLRACLKESPFCFVI